MSSGFFTRALMKTLLLASIVAAGPAMACKGSQTLLRDDFTDEDPAWNITTPNAVIGGGVLKLASDAGKIFNLMYQGQNFPGADVCVDIIAPSGKPSPEIRAGVGLWTGKAWNFAYIATDGTAGVDALQASNWLTPVPNRKFDGIKTTPNSVNQLRLTWQAAPPSTSKDAPDPTVTIFINDKQFTKFKVQPNSDRSISVYVNSSGAIYQFKNLVVTD